MEPYDATCRALSARPAEAGVQNLAEQCVLMTVAGPGAGALLAAAGVAGVMEQAPGVHSVFGFEGRPVLAAHGRVLQVDPRLTPG